MSHDPRSSSILLIDDDPEILEIYSEGLKSVDLKVVAFSDSSEALSHAISDQQIGVVICDYKLGDQDGLSLIQSIRACTRSSPWIQFVLITGHPSIAMSVEALKAGISDFIEKPCTLPVLRDVALRALARCMDARTLHDGKSSTQTELGNASAENTHSDIYTKGKNSDVEVVEILKGIWKIQSRCFESYGLDDLDIKIIIESYDVRRTRPNIFLSTLSHMDGYSASTAMRRVHDLVKVGLLERIDDADDRRRSRIAITEKGMRVVDDFLEKLRNYFF